MDSNLSLGEDWQRIVRWAEGTRNTHTHAVETQILVLGGAIENQKTLPVALVSTENCTCMKSAEIVPRFSMIPEVIQIYAKADIVIFCMSVSPINQ